jgi:CRISPR-associated protein Cmr2
MGKVIAHRDTVPAHQELSQALDEFARNAKEIVEDVHKGELIYSGGDDVLAFVPLNKAIQCAQALRLDFAKKLEQFAFEEVKPSLSVGIAICHFMDPMGDAFKLARQAEKKAKEKRNSLAVIVDKRSGPPTTVWGTWGTVDEDLQKFTKWHRQDFIPDGVAFELQELHTILHGADKSNYEDLKKMINVETIRILGRKRGKHGAEEMAKEIRDDLLNAPEQLAERLIVARLIAQAIDIAEGELDKTKKEPT